MKHKILLASVAALSVCASCHLAMAQTPAPAPGMIPLPKVTYDPATQIPKERTPASVKDGFNFVAVGDILIGQPVLAQAGPDVDKVLKLVRDADAAMANQEAPLVDQKRLHLPNREGGSINIGTPEIAKDVKAMGIDMVSVANNHSVDWGLQTVEQTAKALDAEGIIHAGGGRNRTEARAPAYFDTPKGRVGFVAAASTTNVPSMAQDDIAEGPARPGISVVRTTRIASVSAEEMNALKAVAARYGRRSGANANGISLLGQNYRVSDQPGFSYTMNPIDEFEVLKSVRGAKQVADMVVFTIHAHESQMGSDENHIPADFQPKLFHDVIDAGADVVAVTGSHALRGVEIYKGKPIFYSLGVFAFQANVPPTQDALESLGVDMTRVTPAEVKAAQFDNPPEWSDTVVTSTIFGPGGMVKEVRIYPLVTNPVPPNKLKGVPHMASPEAAKRILETMKDYSAAFGTDFRIENGVGVIRPKS